MATEKQGTLYLHEALKIVSLTKKYGDACVRYETNKDKKKNPDLWAQKEIILDELKKFIGLK